MSAQTPDFMLEIFLQPGEFFWGDSDTRIRTILGSCVALCYWHPRLKIGGMVHYLLPSRIDRTRQAELDGRYGDEAMSLILKEIEKSGTRAPEYHIKIFGGSNMFKNTSISESMNIGLRNIEMGKQLIAQHGFQLKSENVGGDFHRNIMFDLWSGDVWLKKPKDTKEVKLP